MILKHGSEADLAVDATELPELRFVPPRQARSQTTLDAILDATEHLLAQKDFEEIQVREVVKLAGSSIGSFYARFRDKDALLIGLQERFLAGRERTREEQLRPSLWEGVPLSVRVRAMVRLAIAYNRTHQGLSRAVLNHQLRGKAAESPELTRSMRTTLEPWIEFLLACRDEMDHPDPETAVPFAMYMAQRTVDGLTLMPPAHRMELVGESDEELCERVATMMLRMLGSRG